MPAPARILTGSAADYAAGDRSYRASNSIGGGAVPSAGPGGDAASDCAADHRAGDRAADHTILLGLRHLRIISAARQSSEIAQTALTFFIHPVIEISFLSTVRGYPPPGCATPIARNCSNCLNTERSVAATSSQQKQASMSLTTHRWSILLCPLPQCAHKVPNGTLPPKPVSCRDAVALDLRPIRTNCGPDLWGGPPRMFEKRKTSAIVRNKEPMVLAPTRSARISSCALPPMNAGRAQAGMLISNSAGHFSVATSHGSLPLSEGQKGRIDRLQHHRTLMQNRSMSIKCGRPV